MSDSKYLRDGRAPIPNSENISKVMSSNKGKDTKPELELRKFLWKNNLRGYRLHNKKLPGRPDIVFSKAKLAIFVNGCYWHRCPKCKLAIPKSNVDFWRVKFEKNILRDMEKYDMLTNKGWKVIVIWECDINNDIFSALNKVKQYFEYNETKSS